MDYDFIVNGRAILMTESWFSLFSYLSIFVNFRLHGIVAKSYRIADYANRRKIKASPNRTENRRDVDQRRKLWGENEVCLLLIDEQSTTHPLHGLHTIPKRDCLAPLMYPLSCSPDSHPLVFRVFPSYELCASGYLFLPLSAIFFNILFFVRNRLYVHKTIDYNLLVNFSVFFYPLLYFLPRGSPTLTSVIFQGTRL